MTDLNRTLQFFENQHRQSPPKVTQQRPEDDIETTIIEDQAHRDSAPMHTPSLKRMGASIRVVDTKIDVLEHKFDIILSIIQEVKKFLNTIIKVNICLCATIQMIIAICGICTCSLISVLIYIDFERCKAS
jgi:hypothetical protein